jgi:hypothetical protein
MEIRHEAGLFLYFDGRKAPELVALAVALVHFDGAGVLRR